MANDGRKRTLLIADDSPVTRSAVRKAVEQENLFSSIVEAADGLQAFDIFFKQAIDFVITDIVMPGMDGYELVAGIRASERGRDIPIIILSASRQEVMDKILAFHRGANDFIVKPFHSGELSARVGNFLKILDLQSELKQKNESLQKLSTTDELTGLNNRRFMQEHFKMHLALAKRHDYGIGCLMIDIDSFKQVNDSCGHDYGDRVLKEVAKTLSRKMRGGEVLARFGGEEFIACLCNVDMTGALIAAERLRKSLSEADLQFPPQCPSILTVSIGVAVYPHEGIESGDDLIVAADKALYLAKQRGKNRSESYSSVVV